MKHLRVWLLRLMGIFPNRKRELDFAEELESHLQMHIEDNRRSGLPPDEARRQALLKLGGVEQAKQDYRARSTVPLLADLLQDLRFAVRQFGRCLTFSITVTVVLALGIGTSVAIFAFAQAALIKPLPYVNPEQLVEVTESSATMARGALSYPDYLDWKRLNNVFTSMAIWTPNSYALRTSSGTEQASGARVSDQFFRTLGVNPLLGHDFDASADSPDAPPVVLLSYGAWQKWLGGQPDVVGRSITLDERPYTVIGVLPREYYFVPRGRAQFWTNLQPSSPRDLKRSFRNFFGIARLKNGASQQTAAAAMSVVAAQLERQYPDWNSGQGASVIPLSEASFGRVRRVLVLLLSGALLLLLIALINVVSLVLVRSETRRREVALRGALGASHGRIVRQFAAEGTVLAGTSSIVGVTFAYGLIHAFLGVISDEMMFNLPFLDGVGLTPNALAFASVMSVISAILLTIAPALRPSLSDLQPRLMEAGQATTGRVWQHFASNLVVVQLATAMVLLVGAGLLGKSMYRLLHVNLGFQPDHLVTLSVGFPRHTSGRPEQEIGLVRDVISTVAALPGVVSVGTGHLPVGDNRPPTWIRLVGKPFHGEHNEVGYRVVSPDYFATIKAKLLKGRYFSEDEDNSKPGVVIINRRLAQQFFPGEDPIGKQIGNYDLSSVKEIVGTVEDIREGSLDDDIWPAVYYPFNQAPMNGFSLAVRTLYDPLALLPTVTKAIHALDPGIETFDEATMSQKINDSDSAWLLRSSSWLVGGFGGTALLLGVVGLYGVISYSVASRTREIGVRMALGASHSSIHQLVLSEAGKLMAMGVIVGIGFAELGATLIRKLLFGTQAWDIAVFATVASGLIASGILAAYVPSRRATSINPADCLRSE